MAAIHAVLMAFPGGVVVLPDDLYHGVVSLIDGTMAAWGLRTVRYAADGGTCAVEAALDKAIELAGGIPGGAAGPASSRVLLWVETPSNPLLRIVDVRAACSAARARGVASAVDSTWLTPALCRPLDLGADVVVHSVSGGLSPTSLPLRRSCCEPPSVPAAPLPVHRPALSPRTAVCV